MESFPCFLLKKGSEFAQSCPTLCDPWTVAHQAPPSMGFSRQEYWSGERLPSPLNYSNTVLINTSIVDLETHEKKNGVTCVIW